MSVEINNNGSRHRSSKRVKLFKKIIILLLITAILVPIVLCIVLFGKIDALEKQMIDLYQTRAYENEVKLEQMNVENRQMASEIAAQDAAVIQEDKEASFIQTQPRRKVYLTFDDGPSANTDEILDILKEYNVKATFFVVGKEEAKYLESYKRIVAEGHTLGMHSYSHKYNEIYSSLDSYRVDLKKLQDFIVQITGVMPTIVRFPGGSSNQVSKVDIQELIAYLDKEGITYYDWNISSGDANSGFISTQQIVSNSVDRLEYMNDEAVILMHDSSNKKTTVEALPIIIERIQAMEDTALLPILEDTVPVQHVKRMNKIQTED